MAEYSQMILNKGSEYKSGNRGAEFLFEKLSDLSLTGRFLGKIINFTTYHNEIDY